MNAFEIVIAVFFIIGGLALIYTILKYPKDIFRSIFIGIPKLFLERIWSYLVFFTTPIWLPILLLDNYFKWGLTKKVVRVLPFQGSDKDYKGVLKKIDFKELEKFIFLAYSDKEKIELSIKEFSESIKMDLSELNLSINQGYMIVELPKIGFYGYSILIQMLNEFSGEVFGFAKSKNLSFFLYQDPLTTNNLIGKTDKNDLFSISLYDDLDENPYLKISNKVEVSSKLSTAFFSELLSKSTAQPPIQNH